MSRVITREASELGWAPGLVEIDLVVEGVKYYRQNAVCDREGDVMYWEYHPLSHQHPETIVRVFND